MLTQSSSDWIELIMVRIIFDDRGHPEHFKNTSEASQKLWEVFQTLLEKGKKNEFSRDDDFATRSNDDDDVNTTTTRLQ